MIFVVTPLSYCSSVERWLCKHSLSRAFGGRHAFLSGLRGLLESHSSHDMGARLADDGLKTSTAQSMDFRACRLQTTKLFGHKDMEIRA
jgi:hypothetical protein